MTKQKTSPLNTEKPPTFPTSNAERDAKTLLWHRLQTLAKADDNFKTLCIEAKKPADPATALTKERIEALRKNAGIAIKKQVGLRLKESRLIAGYTQAEVARKLQMTQQQYSRFENGVFELNYIQLIMLCNLFDVSSDFLLGLTNY